MGEKACRVLYAVCAAATTEREKKNVRRVYVLNNVTNAPCKNKHVTWN